eukprot:gene32109-16626_t
MESESAIVIDLSDRDKPDPVPRLPVSSPAAAGGPPLQDADEDDIQMIDLASCSRSAPSRSSMGCPGEKRSPHAAALPAAQAHGSRGSGKRARQSHGAGAPPSSSLSSPVVVLLDDDDDDDIPMWVTENPGPSCRAPPDANQESKTGPRGRTRTQRQDQNQNQQQQEKQQQQPPLAPALLAACTCPSCDDPLSHRDLRQLLGPSITHRLYTCIAMYLLDTPSTQVGQQDVDLVAAAHFRAAAVAAAAAAAAAAGSSGGCEARASVHLSHQRACCPGTPASFISGLYDSLVGQEQQQKQESTGGAAGAGELQREEEESQVQGGGRGGKGGKKGKKGKGGKGGKGKGRGGGGPGGGRGKGESATWAAGTGYGGGGSSKDEATAGMKKAALR